MVYLILVFSAISVLFCGARAECDLNKKKNVEKTRSYENFFPENGKNWHFGLEASYLYWMIGTHCTYANVFKSERINSNVSLTGFKPFAYLRESHSEIVSDAPVSSSGLSARISAMSESKKGWEYGLKYQWISHTDDSYDCCARNFSDSGFIFMDDPIVNSMPQAHGANGLLAAFNLGHEASSLFHSSMVDLALVGFSLDKIEQTFDFYSATLDISNFGLLFNSNTIKFGVGFGLEFDLFKNIIEVRGGETFLDFEEADNTPPSAGLNPLTAYWFAYKLKSKPCAIGPFLKVDGAWRCESNNHIFLFGASLYGAGLYTQNNYQQYFEKSDMAIDYYSRWFESGGQGVPPNSIYPASPCTLNFGCPDFCYEPRTTMYHAKVTLGFKYEFLREDSEFHVGIDWETNSFLNFFDRDFLVYSHDDLNYQGLTATVGFAF